MNDIWKWFEYVAVVSEPKNAFITPRIRARADVGVYQVGQIPWVDRLWVKNHILSRIRPAKWSPMVRFAVKRQEERQGQISAGEGGYNDRDFLSRFLDAMQKDSSIPSW